MDPSMQILFEEILRRLSEIEKKIEGINQSRWVNAGKVATGHFLLGVVVQLAVALLNMKGLR